MKHKPVLVLHIKPLMWLAIIFVDIALWFIIINFVQGSYKLILAIFGG